MAAASNKDKTTTLILLPHSTSSIPSVSDINRAVDKAVVNPDVNKVIVKKEELIINGGDSAVTASSPQSCHPP